MTQGKIFEDGGALPDGYSLDNYLFGETFSKINVEPLNEQAQALVKKFIEDPKMSAIKMSHPKAISAYGHIIKEHQVKDSAEIVDVLVAREFIKQHYVTDESHELAVSILDEYLKIKNKMSDKIINADDLEKISSLLPNIVYKELKAYTTGAEPEVSVEPVAPVVEVVEPKALSVDEKIKSFTGKINGYKIKLKRASAEDADKISKKIKGYEIKLKGLAIKKKNGGTILEKGGVMGDVFTIEDPKEFQQVMVVYDEMKERFGVEKEYTDHNAKRVVFITKHGLGAADIYQIKEYWNTLKRRGFYVFDYDATAFKKPFQTLTSNSFYFKLKDSVKYKEGGNVIEVTSSVQDPKPTGADETAFTHTAHDPEQMGKGGDFLNSLKEKAKGAYHSSKEAVAQKVHDTKKDIAYDVLQETRGATPDDKQGKKDSSLLNEASNLVDEYYAKGGEVGEVEELWKGYASAVLFTETDSDTQESLDSKYSISDFDEKTIKSSKRMLAEYYSKNKEAIKESGLDLDTVGNDIWYTRAGHGVGFFDHSLDEDVEEKLTKGAKALGEMPNVETYDGKISISGGRVFKYTKGGNVYDAERNSEQYKKIISGAEGVLSEKEMNSKFGLELINTYDTKQQADERANGFIKAKMFHCVVIESDGKYLVYAKRLGGKFQKGGGLDNFSSHTDVWFDELIDYIKTEKEIDPNFNKLVATAQKEATHKNLATFVKIMKECSCSNPKLKEKILGHIKNIQEGKYRKEFKHQYGGKGRGHGTSGKVSVASSFFDLFLQAVNYDAKHFEKGGVAGEKKYVMTAYSADIVEYSYEEGEIGKSVSDWHLKESKEFDSKQKLIDYMNKLMYVDYKEEHFNWEDGEGKNIQTDVLCSMDSQGDFSPASEHEKELFKKGEKKLYNCHYWFYVLPVTVHDSYAKGGQLGDSVHINDVGHRLNGKAGLIMNVDGDNYSLKVLDKGEEVDVVISKEKTTPFPEDID